MLKRYRSFMLVVRTFFGHICLGTNFIIKKFLVVLCNSINKKKRIAFMVLSIITSFIMHIMDKVADK